MKPNFQERAHLAKIRTTGDLADPRGRRTEHAAEGIREMAMTAESRFQRQVGQVHAGFAEAIQSRTEAQLRPIAVQGPARSHAEDARQVVRGRQDIVGKVGKRLRLAERCRQDLRGRLGQLRVGSLPSHAWESDRCGSTICSPPASFARRCNRDSLRRTAGPQFVMRAIVRPGAPTTACVGRSARTCRGTRTWCGSCKPASGTIRAATWARCAGASTDVRAVIARGVDDVAPMVATGVVEDHVGRVRHDRIDTELGYPHGGLREGQERSPIPRPHGPRPQAVARDGVERADGEELTFEDQPFHRERR